MKYIAILAILALTGCVAARDPLTQANIEEAELIWRADKVPTVSDKDWLAMSDEDKKLHMPMSKHKLREYFFFNAIFYESSKGKAKDE